jgi:hypothetical protein
MFPACDNPTNDPTPTVTGVSVSPETATVAKGETRQFSAAVTGEYDPAQTVTWTIVETDKAAGTTINSSGLLTVAADETLTSLTIKATSTVDTTKSGMATVLIGAPPTVSGITVSPETATVAKGETRQFTAAVAGTGTPAQTVTWTIVETGKAAQTAVNASGLLTVAADETLTSLTVKATSTVDTAKSGVATVTVINSVERIEITTLPDKTVYLQGQDLDLAGIVVTATLVDTTMVSVPVSDLAVSGYDKNTAGTQTVTLSYGGKTVSFEVTVNGEAAPTVTGVTVSPQNTSVSKGGTAQFSAQVTGTGSYSQAVTWSVTGNTAGGTTISTTGLLTVAAGETAAALTVEVTSTVDPGKSAAAAVTVIKPLKAIVINTPPSKTTYALGEDLDLAGIVVTATFTDNTTEPVAAADLVVSGYDKNTAGTQTVTLSYGGKTVSFEVTINSEVAPTVTGVTISPQNTSAAKGRTAQFNAQVTGTGSYSQAVTWSVEGNTDSGTTINASGLLTVAAEETAGTLTVKAASTADAGKSDTATVTVSDEAAPASAAITINFQTENIVITSNNPESTSLTLSVADADSYADFQWILDGTARGETTGSVTIDTSILAPGTHRITVFAVKAGKSYSHEVTFRIDG